MKKQADLISDFLNRDKFLLLILDACRYDIMNQLKEGVEKCRGPALNTQYWLKRTWTNYYDLTYFSSVPMIGRKDLKGYLATEHFEKVVEVWENGWSDDLGTVPPESLVKAYKEREPDKAVVHFLQPHVPYIGEYKINLNDGRNDVENLAKYYGDDKLKRAYLDNFEYVWENGVEVLKEESSNVVVTADHGELLGEEINGEKRYGHNAPDCSILKNIPWKVFNHVDKM